EWADIGAASVAGWNQTESCLGSCANNAKHLAHTLAAAALAPAPREHAAMHANMLNGGCLTKNMSTFEMGKGFGNFTARFSFSCKQKFGVYVWANFLAEGAQWLPLHWALTAFNG